ncbi:RNA-binding region-containing protein 3 [Anabrus simplex]|uniref:RNA-binding region-containing protein 3 n=1 Tax=Anabrus simplex TaxID=316456 RepID=UPI0035A28A8B
MIASKTLRIRHLSPDLTDEEKEELLVHFGAVRVKVLSSKIRKNSVVFASFNTEAEAKVALGRLHQLDVLGYPLCVEFARGDENKESLPEKKHTLHISEHGKENSQKHYESFLHKLNSWNSSVSFTQPPPAHLRYQYPPPTHAILANIAHALASVPKFYTQVLHLMNKMNLPSPFEKVVFPSPNIPVGNVELVSTKPSEKPPEAAPTKESRPSSSSEESEIESDEGSKPAADVIPVKRTQPQSKKKVKRPKFVKPVSSTTTNPKTAAKPEDVFEKVECEPVQRKIELHLVPTTSTVSTEEVTAENAGGFGLLFPKHKDTSENVTENSDEDKETELSFISAEELAGNRLSSRDQKHLPVFKHYQPGIPSCRLYIKNLAKHVDERDLHYIYRRYLIPGYEEQGSMFDIRLMKEGRMKGQAFITLQNTKQAQLALQETNGYILKDKPMVVQFARSAVAKDKV